MVNPFLFIRVLRSGLFKLDFARTQAPELPQSLVAALSRYLSDTSFWKIATHPLFDGRFYLEQNSDIEKSSINPLLHYLVDGDQQGRDPHPLFSASYYRERTGGRAGKRTTLEHYLRCGEREECPPFPGFDYNLYREHVSKNLKGSRVLIDFALNYTAPSRQEFASLLIERALNDCPRASARGSLNDRALAKPAQAGSNGRCDVVIPVKNAIDWLDRCLEFLLESANPAVLGSIILVDDSSSPESQSFLSELARRDSRIVLIANDADPGFAAACNSGFRRASAPHVLFLNSDCLANTRSIEKMLEAFLDSPRVGIACAIANNAANATLPIAVGQTFLSMDTIVEKLALSEAIKYPDICTTVGHCLMVSRECYEAVGGMDESWGLGYGEESDLHLRARARGFLGVFVLDAYVYHFGGGAFRQERSRAELQRVNHERFKELWRDAFPAYYRIAYVNNPLPKFDRQVEALVRAEVDSVCDVLFVLPCIVRGIGGVHVALDLCNHLIKRGIDARLVVLGLLDREALGEYTEPLYTNPYHAEGSIDLFESVKVRPRVVVTTLFSTVPPAWKLARQCGAKLVNFVQGFEVYFLDGKPYEEVRESYFLADTSITTSTWLTEQVRRKAIGCDVRRLPLGINRFLFYPRVGVDLGGPKKLRIGLVLRASVDKGQFVLRELVEMLFERDSEFCVTVFKPDDYPLKPPGVGGQGARLVSLPASRVTLAQELREIDIFVDASLHEGFGLFPLEAMGCGACVVASDSGGVTEYLKDGINGKLVVAVNKPEAYLDRILELSEDRVALRRMREAAIVTAASYDEHTCFDQYERFFASLLNEGDRPMVATMKDIGNIA